MKMVHSSHSRVSLERIKRLALCTATGASCLALCVPAAVAQDTLSSSLVARRVTRQKEPDKSPGRIVNRKFSGNVSWYGAQFHGRKTASGRLFDMHQLTAAHKTLPFGTKVLLENPKTGQSVVVEVIDRGPFHTNRCMDVSREAARRLGTLLGGVSYVYCLVLDDQDDNPPEKSEGR